MIYDEKRKCWWFYGECHRVRTREDVAALVASAVVILGMISLIVSLVWGE